MTGLAVNQAELLRMKETMSEKLTVPSSKHFSFQKEPPLVSLSHLNAGTNFRRTEHSGTASRRKANVHMSPGSSFTYNAAAEA